MTKRSRIRAGLCGLLLAACLFLTAVGVTSLRAEPGACPAADGWTEFKLPNPRSSQRLSATAVAAGYDEPGKLYIGANEGLYVTADCGASWNVIVRDTFLHGNSRSVTSVQVDETGTIYVGRYMDDPLTIISEHDQSIRIARQYRQSGEQLGPVRVTYMKVSRDGSRAYTRLPDLEQPSLSGWPPRGWTISQDGGQRWTVVAREAPGIVYAVGPQSPDTVYAVGPDSSVFKSEDGGITKSLHAQFDDTPSVADGQAVDRATIDRARDISVSGYTGTGWIVTQFHTLYRSDGGLTEWRQRSPVPDVQPAKNTWGIRLAASQFDANVAFVVTSDRRLWAYRMPAAAP